MREHIAGVCALVLAILLSTVARAQPGCAVCGVWAIEQVYSNADGSIQFLMVQSARYNAVHFVAQQLAGQTLIASDGVTERRISFTTEIPDVTNRPILIASREFADLGLIKPDYIMPAGFLFQRNGSLRLRDSSWNDRDILLYNALPTDGKAALYMDIDGDYTDIATATNNAGASYRFTPNADNSFRMTAIFSDQAGLFQYIQLEEGSGKNDQNHFARLTLEVTSHGGVCKSISFPSDLPSTDTAGRPVLLGTTHVGLPQTDFELPEGFLPTDGGTLVFAGVDVWDYPQLPANGYTVVRRDGGLTSNPSSFAGLVFRPFTGFPTGLLVPMDPVVEYYNKRLDHYFVTASQPDIDALDSKRIFGWERTGESFPAWIAPQLVSSTFQSPPGMGPVCRLYLPQRDSSSHFFSASAGECSESLAKHPDYLEETSSAFFASLPDLQTGQCGYDQIPVYRLWNARVDSNHRYTVSPAIRDFMKSRSYVAEGYGPDAVAMCVAGGIPNEYQEISQSLPFAIPFMEMS